MWELDYKESWAPKNWCFWTITLEKTLESPLDCKEIQPLNPKEISPEYSLEGLMLKLKCQYFGHLMWRSDSLEKTLMLGKIEGRRRSGWQRMRWLDGITDSMDMGLSEPQELVMARDISHDAVHGVAKIQTRLSDWSGLNRWCSGKESSCPSRKHKRHKFDPWVKKIFWNRKWRPTPVFFPGKLHGERSLVGYSIWGRKVWDTTEHTHTHFP